MPAPHNPLKAALAEGRLQIGLWLGLCDPTVAFIAARAGYDWCLLDAEHGPNTLSTLLAQFNAMGGGTAAPVVRVAEGTDTALKHVLDMGAQTIVVPMVETPAQAEAIVAACRYAPRGRRGMAAAIVRASDYGAIPDYVATADDEICILVQAESRKALTHIAEIAAVDGVDGVFIGPADLAADMGYPGEVGVPEVEAAIAAATQTVRDAGKAVGNLTLNEDDIAPLAHGGATFIAVGSDVDCVSRGLRGLALRARAAIGAI